MPDYGRVDDDPMKRRRVDIFYIACLAMGLVGIVGTLVVGEFDSELGDTGDGLRS